MNKVVFTGLATALTVLAAGAGQAEGFGPGRMGGMGPMGERPSFAELDADGNGSVSIAEIRARGAARFAEADTDGDGKLTAEEISAAIAARAAERAAAQMARMIEWRDVDGDGALSLPEMGSDGGPRMFMFLDADEDGEISAEEYAEAGKMRARDGADRGQRHMRGHDRGGMDGCRGEGPGDGGHRGWRMFGHRG